MESISSSLRIEFSLMLFFFIRKVVCTRRACRVGGSKSLAMAIRVVKSERSGSVWFYSKVNK